MKYVLKNHQVQYLIYLFANSVTFDNSKHFKIKSFRAETGRSVIKEIKNKSENKNKIIYNAKIIRKW